jgi:hypothetical protein
MLRYQMFHVVAGMCMCRQCYAFIADRAIRHRACALKDTAYAIIAAELDTDFGKLCEEIYKARERRGSFISRFVFHKVLIHDVSFEICV